MHRPGVDYWAHTHPSLPPAPRRSASSSSGPPSLTRTSTADFYAGSDDVTPSARLALSSPALDHNQDALGLPSPMHASTRSTNAPPQQDGAATLQELEDAKRRLAELKEHQRLEEGRVSRMQAAWTREGLDYANSLKAVQTALERERALRTNAELARQGAVRESHQLRAALRVLLAQPLSNSSTTTSIIGSSNTVGDAVPLPLYTEARHLLLQCERTFAELKMLQLNATDAAGLERLRLYDVPVLDGIPPPWPPETPQRDGRDAQARRDSAEDVVGASTPNPLPAATCLTAEETPTGPEVSALTTVSPDTPCSPPAHLTRAVRLSHSCPHDSPLQGEAVEAGVEEKTRGSLPAVEVAAAPTQQHNGGNGARRVLLRPPILSPPADANSGETRSESQLRHSTTAKADWSGPMHKFSGDGPTPAAATPGSTLDGTGTYCPLKQLQPQPGALLTEFDREDIIRDTDKLLRQLSRETAALAKSQGTHQSTDVAALCRHRGLDYVDPSFLPVTASLGLAAGGCRGYDPDRGRSFVVQWCTRDAFLPRGQPAQLLSSTGVDPNALRCGPLGDTGVVAALAALAEATGAVSSVLASTTSRDESNGVYVVWLCLQGWWTRTTVDAYLPCICAPDRTVILYGCSDARTHDLWAPVIEKALAKVYGTYAALRHLRTDVVLGHLTGGPVECWEWWHQRSDTALDEIEAAINTSARGAGIVTLTTHSPAALRDASRSSLNTIAAAVATDAAYRRVGLLPGTAYRVLAVTENADGESMLLLRNWAKSASALMEGEVAATCSERGADRRDISPLRDNGDGPMMHLSSTAAVAAARTQYDDLTRNSRSREDGCVWLNYRTEVLPLFDACHVCFDCRRYHDVRVPIQFHGTAPAVPAQVIRVRVQGGRNQQAVRRLAPAPTRLWIGLHQPGVGQPACSGKPAAPWALKVTLIGQEEAPALTTARGSSRKDLYRNGSAPHGRPARRSYILSESFMGESQPLPAVWMYLELDAQNVVDSAYAGEGEDSSSSMEFFVVPQMELVETTCGSLNFYPAMEPDCKITEESNRLGGGTKDATGGGPLFGQARENENVHDEATGPLWSHRLDASCFLSEGSLGSCMTAVVAILAERMDSVAVDVVEAPEELRAAMYHDVVDRIDFSECALLSGSLERHQGPTASTADAGVLDAADVRCQVNGRCFSAYSW